MNTNQGDRYGALFRADLAQSPWRTAIEGAVTLGVWAFAIWVWWIDAERWQLGIVIVLVFIASLGLVYVHGKRVWKQSHAEWKAENKDLRDELALRKAQDECVPRILAECGSAQIEVYPQDERNLKQLDLIDGTIIYASFRNDPIRRSDTSIALALGATVEAIGEGGTNIATREGRWWQHPPSFGWINSSAATVSMAPNNKPLHMLLALRTGEPHRCYLFTGGAAPYDWSKSDAVLMPESFVVRVTLRGIGVDQSVHTFRITQAADDPTLNITTVR